MSRFYSKSTGGFYSQAFHQTMPADAIPVSDETHAELMAAQSNGQTIVADANGNPVAQAQAVIAPTIDQQIIALEAQQTPRRYREAINGTDNGWLKAQDAKIAVLRAQLAKTPSA